MKRFRRPVRLAFAIAATFLLAVVLVAPVPALEQIRSANFTVNESAINNGGGTRTSPSFIVWTDSIGEGVIGVLTSANFIAYTSFVPAATHSAGVPVEISSFRLE